MEQYVTPLLSYHLCYYFLRSSFPRLHSTVCSIVVTLQATANGRTTFLTSQPNNIRITLEVVHNGKQNGNVIITSVHKLWLLYFPLVRLCCIYTPFPTAQWYETYALLKHKNTLYRKTNRSIYSMWICISE